MAIKFILKETLDSIGVTPNRFSTLSQVRNNTIYDMIYNDTKRIDVKNLDSIVSTLNALAKEKGIKKKFSLSDVAIWEDK